MSEALTKKINVGLAEQFWSRDWYTLIEQHMTYLRADKSNVELEISLREKEIFDGNFIGFLNSHNLPPHLHYVTMRLNGLDSTLSDFSHLNRIIIPNPERINRMYEMMMTTQY